ncbi:hypothetical protein NDU88_002669 [Pleurodeles waltl]|uniref:Uncharacterized protein n=1 Tax=Pleurodeles waltl TaxID=8319 RepID=A0AAV7Q9J5_PLEWA|nr:hypothetical protein NDU88_002669 [Pleurodeles waltl]
MLTSRAVRSEDRDPILGLQPCRALMTAHGRRKGPPRAPQPLTRTAASPVARPRAPRLPPRFSWDAPQRLAAQHALV